MQLLYLESAALSFPGNVNEVPLLPDLKAGFPEVKPGTGSLISVGITVRLSVTLLLWGLQAPTAWVRSACRRWENKTVTKHRNSFIPCFLDQAYQTLLGKEEGK